MFIHAGTEPGFEILKLLSGKSLDVPGRFARLRAKRENHRTNPVSASQSRAVLSLEAVSTRRPSGLKTALSTKSLWPCRVARSLPLSAFQSCAVLSPEAVSTRRPSGLKTALVTRSVWPWKVAKSLSRLGSSQDEGVTVLKNLS